MKLLMFDFKCNGCGAEFEDLVESAVRVAPCLKCGANADRQISAVRFDRLKAAASGDGMPGAVDYFDRVHRERKAIEERKEREHGDYGPAAGAD